MTALKNTMSALSGNRGATLLEMTFILPVFLLLVFALIGFSVFFVENLLLQDAVRITGRTLAIAAPATMADAGGFPGCVTQARNIFATQTAAYNFSHGNLNVASVTEQNLRGVRLTLDSPVDCLFCPLIRLSMRVNASLYYPLEDQTACQ